MLTSFHFGNQNSNFLSDFDIWGEMPNLLSNFWQTKHANNNGEPSKKLILVNYELVWTTQKSNVIITMHEGMFVPCLCVCHSFKTQKFRPFRVAMV